MDFSANDSLTIALASTSRAIIIASASDSDNKITFINEAFTTLTGYAAIESIGRNCRFLQGPNSDPAKINDLREAIAAGRSIRCEMLNYRKDGQAFWADLTIDPIHDEAGKITGFISVQHDCSEKYAALAARDESEQRLSAIASSVPGFIYQRVLTPVGELGYPYLSRSIFQILGIPFGDKTSNRAVMARIHEHDCVGIERLIIESAVNLTPFTAEYRLVSMSGEDHWFRSTSKPRKIENGNVVWDGLAIEITAQKHLDERIAHLSQHDPLTGVANRLAFTSGLGRVIANVSDDAAHTGVLSIDLDDFQAINDMVGSEMADQVLQRIAMRLKEYAGLLGGSVARMGGDEFALLLPRLTTEDSALVLAEGVVTEIRRPMVLDGETVAVEACVGAATLPHLSDFSQAAAANEWGAELLNRANLALHEAKRDGPGAARIYSARLDDRIRVGPELKKSLKQALAANQFTLHYQPLVNLVSGEIVGAEALLRWEHPELGLQRPDLFIPIAETSGLIIPLGAWVVKTAMCQAEAWKREGLRPVRIAINVSSIQLQNAGFLAMVQQALLETGADPHQFEFELTEGILLHASAEIKDLFDTLRAMGFGLVIDDFGTGHATLAYLRSYAVDKLKIDQVFVRHLVVDSSDAAIIQAVTTLCGKLNLEVVAEGVETQLQRDFLIAEGCVYGQGYLFSMPLRAEDFGWMLKRMLTLPIQPGQA